MYKGQGFAMVGNLTFTSTDSWKNRVPPIMKKMVNQGRYCSPVKKQKAIKWQIAIHFCLLRSYTL